MEDIVREFTLSKEQLFFEAEKVEKELKRGLKGEPSDFAMLNSYVDLPSGKEEGKYLALDFGGTNLRIAKMILHSGKIDQVAIEKKSIKQLMPAKNATVGELFANIAEMISKFSKAEGGLLGHTFSYPIEQTSANTGKLKKWTKELAVFDAVGMDINKLLTEKLQDIGRADIIPTVILNDTVATLLASSYLSKSKAIIGSICGTGHNTAYYEKERKMVVNLESGNLYTSCQNRFDKVLDSESALPGEQLLEKMVAGNYLAQLTNLVAQNFDPLKRKFKDTKSLVEIINDTNDILHPVVLSIIKRAANLVAAEYFGVYCYLEKKGVILETIAIDGSIYNEMAIFKEELLKTLFSFIKTHPIILSGKGFSLKGAAVACAISK